MSVNKEAMEYAQKVMNCEFCSRCNGNSNKISSKCEKFVFLYGGYDGGYDAAYKKYHEIFKADFNFICKICNYIEEHGNKEDKKWIENLVWKKLVPVYKNQDVDKELVEHLIAQVTDCVGVQSR